MSRVRAVVALLALGAVAVTAASAAGSPNAPTKLTVWGGWGARELSVFKSVVAEYDKSHPNVQVNVVGGINDNKIVAAIRAGNAPDVVSSFNSYNVGTYCKSGGWIDLSSMMSQSGIKPQTFPAATRYYTAFDGKRCALPLLADTYGLYYNKALFKAAGISSPPKTMDELAADAKKLTKYNADGTIKQLGIDPLIGFYENVPERWITSFGGTWLDSSDHSILSKDAAWTQWLTWQKKLVDSIGYSKLVRFQAGLGGEVSASNAFEAGKVAMNLDGGGGVALIPAEHPALEYGAAPLPGGKAGPYGSGGHNGTHLRMPQKGNNQK